MNDSSPTSLVHYDAMCRAIEAAHAVDEVKDIRDKALALETYARQAKNIDAEWRACEIRLRAERRAGQLLKEIEKAKGGRPTETPRADRGVSRTMSIVGLDISAIEKMPGGEVMALVRRILNDEAFRIGTLEEQLIKHNVAGTLNAERIAVVRALHASSDAITLMLATAEQTSRNNELTRTRRELIKLIADQMRAALLNGEEKGAGHDGAAA